MNSFLDRIRQFDWSILRGEGLTIYGINFAHPLVLLLLLLVPLWSWWRRRRKKRQDAIPFPLTGLLARGPRPKLAWTRVLPWLRALAVVGFIVAVAQPRSGARTTRVASEGIDIALAVDISSSMLAEDFQPQNRMEVAKDKLKRFVLGRKSDRVGLVAFSGEALTQVPLTTDYPVLLAAIDNLAGRTARGRYRHRHGYRDGCESPPHRARSLSRARADDGWREQSRRNRSAHGGASRRAFGIRIYAIGVGSEGMAAVPVGRSLFGLRYENRPVKIDEALLTEIATATGGRYFRAKDADALQRIYEQIDTLERSIVEQRAFVRYTEQFRWPLAIGLLALLSELFILARRGVLP
jgi:Ca-activated chloride channel family protein